MIIQTIRYKSGLSHDEVNRRFTERSDRYRKVPGLIQKYYVRFTETGEYAGIYVWDSAESLDAWTAGNLSGTLAETYQIEGEPARELAEVMLVLHEG
jgi:heme-degrading monooxygenase HmoA